MTPKIAQPIRVAVVLLGTESGGIRSFLLNQQMHSAEVAMKFQYIALQDGPMCGALRERGEEVAILNTPPPVTYATAPVAGVARWMLPGCGFGAARRALQSKLAGDLPDCLYSHFLHTHLACGAVGRSLGIPRIGQVHGTINPRRSLGLTRVAYSWALARSLDAIIMVSHTAGGSLAPIARAKARMVYNGIDATAIDAASSGHEKIAGRVIILGRIVPGKKPDVAIRALPLVIKSGTKCTLDVVGGPMDESNEYANQLRRLTKELKVESFVNFTGPLNPPYGRLAAAEICVNCSTVEGLSYVVMEAMLSGTPAIVADQGAPSEMIQHEKSGLHFGADDPASLADAIVRLLGDPQARLRMADAARVYARETFDISTHMQAIRAVFDECLANRRNRPATIRKSPETSAIR